MSETSPATGDPVPLYAWLKPELGAALNLSAADAGESRAGHARRLLTVALTDTGYLAPPQPPHPLRKRTSRRRKTT